MSSHADGVTPSTPGDGEPTPPAGHSTRGLLLFMLGLFLFACMDNTSKYLVAQYPAPMVVAVRYIVNLLLMIAVLAPSHGARMVRTQRTGLVLLRGACLACASLTMTLALSRLPVAEATSFLFLAPLMVLLLTGPVLGEKVGAMGWVAALAGFGGVLLVAHPGGGLDPLGIFFALCTMAVTTGYQLLSRLLAPTEGTIPMLFCTVLIGSLVYGLFLPWSWGGPTPSTRDLFLFASLGVYGGIGHFLFTAAHRDAPTSVLAPAAYTQLIWAGLIGWMVFGHVPDKLGIAGMCIIAAAGALAALRSRFVRRGLAEPEE